MSLFQKTVLQEHLNSQDQEQVLKAYKKYVKYFHNQTIQQNIKESKEEQFQAKIDASDIVQETMLEAHRGLANYRGGSPEELRGWLRKILARNLANEVRKFRRGKRDADLERSLEAGLRRRSTINYRISFVT